MKQVLFIIALTLVLSACTFSIDVIQPSGTNATVTPTDTSIPTMSSPTAVPTPTSQIVWHTYQDDQLGLLFEYPAVYGDPQYSNCGVKVSKQSDQTELTLGKRSSLLIEPSQGATAENYLNDLFQQQGWQMDNKQIVLIGGENAVKVDYRFGGTSRFGTVTALVHKGQRFAFNFTAGTFCDAPEAHVQETEAYQHWQDSFKFLP